MIGKLGQVILSFADLNCHRTVETLWHGGEIGLAEKCFNRDAHGYLKADKGFGSAKPELRIDESG